MDSHSDTRFLAQLGLQMAIVLTAQVTTGHIYRIFLTSCDLPKPLLGGCGRLLIHACALNYFSALFQRLCIFYLFIDHCALLYQKKDELKLYGSLAVRDESFLIYHLRP